MGVRASIAAIDTGIEGEGRRMTRDEAEAFGDRELVAVAPTLLATARYLSRSNADAADLVQATLEIAVRRRSQLRDPDRLRPWLLAILTHEAFRLRRRLRALVSLEGSVIEVAVAGASDDDLAVRAAVAQLPTRMRSAVVLHHMAGLSVAETAQAMGISDNTVKTLLRLGLARLREVLA
jgi:RNA polymerase sigma-70 factor (ECF subfamily)